eukprot:COSAG01_NODE_42388_length_440_cov_1.909091_1_plen_67_part_10
MPSAQLLHQGSLVTLGISAAENFVRAEKLCPRPPVYTAPYKERGEPSTSNYPIVGVCQNLIGVTNCI